MSGVVTRPGGAMPPAKVLVTGATGFIAGHAIEVLLECGHAVRGTVRDRSRADATHLLAAAERSDGDLELVEASLDADEGWAAALAGCDVVWHLASPVPAKVPKDEAELVRPAVDGTMRVLRAAAAAGTVGRVVMLSSTDAVIHGHHNEDRPCTEADWTDPHRATPYPKSKVLAEQAAWAFAKEAGLELVSLNPGLVLGPLLHAEKKTSMEVVRLLLARDLPAVPQISFAVVDVRDVAVALRLATETPAAAGNRYILAAETLWMGEIAAVLRDALGPRGYRVPTRTLPYWAMWLNARVDKTIRLALDYYGVPVRVSADKAARELGWRPRPAAETIVDAGESLLAHGVVKRAKGDRV